MNKVSRLMSQISKEKSLLYNVKFQTEIKTNDIYSAFDKSVK